MDVAASTTTAYRNFTTFFTRICLFRLLNFEKSEKHYHFLKKDIRTKKHTPKQQIIYDLSSPVQNDAIVLERWCYPSSCLSLILFVIRTHDHTSDMYIGCIVAAAELAHNALAQHPFKIYANLHPYYKESFSCFVKHTLSTLNNAYTI